ncbi:hypothetical protein QQY24_06115 [Streptomyces sp. TG1A-8]|uniref:DUF6939 family protein n=1 Tax=Streptomyces sp. TG1A-8 TaxID=3051385 RepID=UPI00265C79B7|nr:hypothetical protein [Streptomyces sp. TG1A-8]MDO0925010.1 hypothetical protein [Streptomyces sp. TG1A-8]
MPDLAAGPRRPRGRLIATSRAEGEGTQARDALRVDTALAAPATMRRFVTLNPFHHDPSWHIPVPGLPDVTASSVESCWQALKIVDGATDIPMLRRPAHKRPPETHRGPGFVYSASTLSYGGRAVDLVTARYLIYLPSYLYVLEHLVPDQVLHEISTAVHDGRTVVFYDWDDNLDIEDPASSFSHSAVLAAWFAGRLEKDFVDRRAAWIRRVLPTGEQEETSALPLDRYRRYHHH